MSEVIFCEVSSTGKDENDISQRVMLNIDSNVKGVTNIPTRLFFYYTILFEKMQELRRHIGDFFAILGLLGPDLGFLDGIKRKFQMV